MSANESLVKSQGVPDEDVIKIDALHEVQNVINQLMILDNKSNPELLPLYSEIHKNIEFTLQELWKFGANANFHRFWEQPQCTCPRMDNEERLGHDYGFIISSICPVHGKGINFKEGEDD